MSTCPVVNSGTYDDDLYPGKLPWPSLPIRVLIAEPTQQPEHPSQSKHSQPLVFHTLQSERYLSISVPFHKVMSQEAWLTVVSVFAAAALQLPFRASHVLPTPKPFLLPTVVFHCSTTYTPPERSSWQNGQYMFWHMMKCLSTCLHV